MQISYYKTLATISLYMKRVMDLLTFRHPVVAQSRRKTMPTWQAVSMLFQAILLLYHSLITMSKPLWNTLMVVVCYYWVAGRKTCILMVYQGHQDRPVSWQMAMESHWFPQLPSLHIS